MGFVLLNKTDHFIKRALLENTEPLAWRAPSFASLYHVVCCRLPVHMGVQSLTAYGNV